MCTYIAICYGERFCRLFVVDNAVHYDVINSLDVLGLFRVPTNLKVKVLIVLGVVDPSPTSLGIAVETWIV